jgi:hypothetical protein
VVKFLLTAGGVALLNIASSKLFGPKVRPSPIAGHQITSRGALEYRRIAYGRAMISGPIVFNATSGAEREYLWYDIALCHGPSSALVAVWFDGEAIPVADIDWTPGTGGADGTGTGDVSTGRWIGENSTGAVQLFYYLGDRDQPVPGILDSTFVSIDSDNRLRGVTHLVVRLLYNRDTEEVWESGPPSDIKGLLDARMCFDKRRYALNDDPDFASVGQAIQQGLRWFSDDAQTTVLDAAFTVASGTLSITDNDDATEFVFSERVPVDAAKRYEVRCDAQQPTGDRRNYLGVAFYDSNGDNITGSGSGATGWGALGTYFYFHVNAAFTGSYVAYSTTFGADSPTAATIPAGAVEMALVGLITRDGPVGTNSTVNLQDFAVYEQPVAGTRHDFADDSTWRWSDNSSVCIADYLTQVMGVAYADIEWPTFVQAAQDCDPLVDIPGGTEKRFTCNGALSLGSTHKDNLDSLVSSCDGRLSYTQGQWRLRASVWSAPVLALDADDLAGPFEVIGSSPEKNRINLIRGFFVDPERLYESVEFPHVVDTDYVLRDGDQVMPYDLELPMTNSATMAQRIAFRNIEQGDNQVIMNVPLNPVGAQLAVGDVVTFDLPELWATAKTLRVIEWARAADGSYPVVLREDHQVDYTDPAETDYLATNTDGISIPSALVPSPSGLAATSVRLGIELSWTNPAAHEFDYINVYESETDQWDDAVLIATVRGANHLVSRSAGELYYYWIKALRVPNQLSAGHPNSETSTVFAIAGDIDLVKLTGATLQDVSISPTNSEVAYRLSSAGAEQSYEGIGGSFADIDDWLLIGSAADYECYMEVLSGDIPTGSAVNTWIGLGTTRTWTLTVSATGTSTFSGRVRIRHAATGREFIAAADNKLVSMSVEESGASVVVSANPGDISLLKVGATCFAGVEFNSSGEEFRNANGGSTVFSFSRGDWLDAGSGVWIERTVNTGTLNWLDAGTGRLALTTSRRYGVTRGTTPGVTTVNITFDFYDAASGGTLLDSVTIDIAANYENFL